MHKTTGSSVAKTISFCPLPIQRIVTCVGLPTTPSRQEILCNRWTKLNLPKLVGVLVLLWRSLRVRVLDHFTDQGLFTACLQRQPNPRVCNAKLTPWMPRPANFWCSRAPERQAMFGGSITCANTTLEPPNARSGLKIMLYSLDSEHACACWLEQTENQWNLLF